LWNKNVKTRLQEERAGSKQNFLPHPNFAEYTYLYVTKLIDRCNG
jgi:hypothetical protein